MISTVITYMVPVIFLVMCRHTEGKLPPYVKVCYRNDPEINDCVIDSVELLRPYLRKGIPELNIPPYEPLRIPRVSLNQGTGPVSIESSFHDVIIHGPSTFNVTYTKIDVDKYKMEFGLKVPELISTGNYKMKGRVLLLPIVGNGHSEGNYSDITSIIKVHGEPFVKDNRTHMHVKDFNIDFHMEKGSIRYDNLFNGDTILTSAMNSFINNNWELVLEEVKPAVEKVAGQLFKELTNRIFHKYSLDELFPLLPESD